MGDCIYCLSERKGHFRGCPNSSEGDTEKFNRGFHAEAGRNRLLTIQDYQIGRGYRTGGRNDNLK